MNISKKDANDNLPFVPSMIDISSQDDLNLPKEFLDQTSTNPKYRNIGIDLLKNGKVAVLMVAGGLSTRMELKSLRGRLPIGPITNRTIFGLQAAKIAALRRRFDPNLIWLIMTSKEVSKSTKNFFKNSGFFGINSKDVIFFDQESKPVFYKEGNDEKYIEFNDGEGDVTSPIGHGGMLEALRHFKHWERLESVEYLYYFQFPNVLERTCDPEIIGYHHSHDFDITTKGFYEYDQNEKVGRIAQINNDLRIIEWRFSHKFRDNPKFKKLPANAGTHIFSLEFIKNCINNGVRLPFYKVPFKSVNTTPRVALYKEECFIFDLLNNTKMNGLVITPRNESYAMVKTPKGKNSIGSAQHAMIELYNKWLKDAGATTTYQDCKIEICPSYAIDAFELKKKIPKNFSYRYGDVFSDTTVKNQSTTESSVILAIRERFGDLVQSQSINRCEIKVPMDALDDCAVIELKNSEKLVIGSDYIRGRQFYLFQSGHMDYFDLGYYLVCANLSDIAAMGAHPIGLTLIFRYPKNFPLADTVKILDGIKAACINNGKCAILGGDSGGASDLVLSASALGRVAGTPLLRSNAKVGDSVYYLGNPGQARAAQLIFTDNQQKILFSGSKYENLLLKWKKPNPLLEQGQVLSQYPYRVACQDGSDGIKTGLKQIATASGVSILIEEKQLQLEPHLVDVAEHFNLTETDLFLGASVDFGLIFTLPEGVDVPILPKENSPPLYRIGKVIEGNGEVLMIDQHGKIFNEFPGEEYRQ